MKFEYYSGLIWISVGIEYEGKLIKIDKCILDTGSATTAIDMDLVDFNLIITNLPLSDDYAD